MWGWRVVRIGEGSSGFVFNQGSLLMWWGPDG